MGGLSPKASTRSCIRNFIGAMSERITVHFEFFSISDEYWHEKYLHTRMMMVFVVFLKT